MKKILGILILIGTLGCESAEEHTVYDIMNYSYENTVFFDCNVNGMVLLDTIHNMRNTLIIHGALGEDITIINDRSFRFVKRNGCVVTVKVKKL